MKFLADMGVALRIVEWLREDGHDALHLREDGLHRLPDGDIFEKATVEERGVLTFDLDYGEIVASSGRQTPSVILFRLHNTRTPHVMDRLRKVLAASAQALEEGVIVIVEESRHRVRRLPMGN